MVWTLVLLLGIAFGLPTANSPSYSRVFFGASVPFTWSIDSSGCQPAISIYNSNNTLIMSFVTSAGSTSWTIPSFLRGTQNNILFSNNQQPGTFLWKVTQCNNASPLVPFYVLQTGQVSVQWPDSLTTLTAGQTYKFWWYNAGLTCVPQIQVYSADTNQLYMSASGTANSEYYTTNSLMPGAPTGRYYAKVTVCSQSAVSYFNFTNPNQKTLTSGTLSTWISDQVVTETLPVTTSWYVGTGYTTLEYTELYTITYESTTTVTSVGFVIED